MAEVQPRVGRQGLLLKVPLAAAVALLDVWGGGVARNIAYSSIGI